MNIVDAVILGVVEGLTEFLPVSSTGHLTIAEKLLGLKVNDQSVTAFTAIIQMGAIVAVVVYFWRDISRLVAVWCRGLFNKSVRHTFDYRFSWYVIAGSVPIGVVGLAAKSLISGPLRSLWVVAGALVLWSAVMIFAERVAPQQRTEREMTFGDVMFVGVAQCIALVPGVSRSGATISAGLLRDFDRVSATRLSFFLSIPALTAAGALEAVSESDAISSGVGWTPTLVGIVVSFIVGYASIAWLLKFVSHHSIGKFSWYRIPAGLLLAGLLAAGVMSAT
ncbi:MAG TPA: undecaprenyl-diphosphate phosphatase [Mycobacteriales bacterium]|nr:undecaprenyl-diphosphate phosphatase [Mycobacteriales bacterium]